MAAPDTGTLYQEIVPYSSESESDTDTNTGSDSDTSSFASESGSDSGSSDYAARVAPRQPPNFRALAQGLSLNTITGQPPQPTFTAYEKGYPTFKSYELAADPSGVPLKTTSISVNNTVMLDSRDRDALPIHSRDRVAPWDRRY